MKLFSLVRVNGFEYNSELVVTAVACTNSDNTANAAKCTEREVERSINSRPP